MKTFVLFLCVTLLITAESSNAQNAEASYCAQRPTDVEGALKQQQDLWSASKSLAYGYYVSVDENSTRSRYEIYSRYAGLTFVLGYPIDKALNILNESYYTGRKISSGWNYEDYSRMGEASIISGKSIEESVSYLRDVYYSPRRTGGWNYIDFSRSASAAFLGGARFENVSPALDQAYQHSLSWWTNGSYSRAVETAFITNTSVDLTIDYLEKVYRAAQKISPGWNDDDYARVARAGLIAKISPEAAVKILDQTYRLIVNLSGGWNYRDYSRMAGAAIITRKTPQQAAEALRDTWNKRSISSGWEYADYSTIAAAALMGRGSLTNKPCRDFFKAW